MLATVLSDVMALAPLYGIVALGFVVIYRLTGVLNFAQGGAFALGAYALYVCIDVLGVPIIPAMIIVGVLGVCLGVVLYGVLFRHLSGRPVFAIVLVTIALAIAIEGLLILAFTGRSYTLSKIHVLETALGKLPGGIQIAGGTVLMLGVYLAMLAVLIVLFRYFSVGIKGRAAGENPELASYRGVRIHVVFAAAWSVATASALLAGGIYATNHQISPTVAEVALQGFAAAMVGGMDSIGGTVLGSLIVALGVSLAFQFANPLLADAMPYVIMLAVLLARPWGIWGSRELIDRV